jgi:hypothetical protein
MSDPKIGVIGAGNLSSRAIYPYIGKAGAELVGVCDLDRAKKFYDAVLGALDVPAGHVDRHRVFWRTKTGIEVDFVVEKDNRPIPIEAKLKSDPDRVPSGMRSFIGTFKPKKALVMVHHGEFGTTKFEGCDVITTNVFDARKHLALAPSRSRGIL